MQMQPQSPVCVPPARFFLVRQTLRSLRSPLKRTTSSTVAPTTLTTLSVLQVEAVVELPQSLPRVDRHLTWAAIQEEASGCRRTTAVSPVSNRPRDVCPAQVISSRSMVHINL